MNFTQLIVLLLFKLKNCIYTLPLFTLKVYNVTPFDGTNSNRIKSIFSLLFIQSKEQKNFSSLAVGNRWKTVARFFLLIAHSLLHPYFPLANVLGAGLSKILFPNLLCCFSSRRWEIAESKSAARIHLQKSPLDQSCFYVSFALIFFVYKRYINLN